MFLCAVLNSDNLEIHNKDVTKWINIYSFPLALYKLIITLLTYITIVTTMKRKVVTYG